VRVICSYVDDVYNIAEALINQDDVTLVKRKDYIASPKDNGYRSLHLVVSVPVFFAEGPKNMDVEVQIRTIAMDYWASLEHQLKYKHEIENEKEIVDKLSAIAENLSEIDYSMKDIRRQIDSANTKTDKVDEIYEKLKRYDKPL